MNNKKGQVGILVTLAIAVIVGLILFQAIASNVEQGTQTVKGATSVGYASGLYTGVLNTPVELVGQELVSVTGVVNRTSGGTVAAANYTIAECIRKSDNLKGICYTALSAGEPLPATGVVNISYSYYPAGYIDDSGARAIAGIIVLLTAIGIVVVVLKGSNFDF